MARKEKEEVVIKENIDCEPLEEVMGDRYATYAKYVIQDRAIPDARDGMKPVQRRIIYSMFREGNFSNKPTRKCAHTVGAVMGKYHPHGDSSIYEALARMSQDWKLRVPLIDFQGNNGSIDGDVPAAYRYTESRLSEAAEEMVRDIDKDTVDMDLTFDDTDFEPDVLPAYFPNLMVNGSEGIAVAMATEIPPHNLGEVADAIIYRFSHKNATSEDLMQFVKGPDFPTGGLISNSEGLKNIYLTGKGRIDISSKCDIVTKGGQTSIIVTEIPYKTIKLNIVYEIDKIRHNKIIDGIQEVRDESDRVGLRIVIDLKKEAKPDVVLAYLMNKTPLRSSYSANMVAIVNGRPKTMNLLMMVDAYIDHQKDVVTRRSKFDLNKYSKRLEIVEGLIKAVSILDEVVKTIRNSKDKQNAKANLMSSFGFSEIQSEAIVMLQLYKLSNTDMSTLEEEKKTLDTNIKELNEILADSKKLDRVIINDLKDIAKKYGDARRTMIVDEEKAISVDKRDLIIHEDTMICLTRDGYIKRSTIKSFKGSGENAAPGIKEGDAIVYQGSANTADFLLAFTNTGNYLFIPVYEIVEGKWKDEGKHINYLISINSSMDKIIKAFVVRSFRDDLYFAFISKRGQIKRTKVSEFKAVRYSKPITAMRLLKGDTIANVVLTNGNSNLMIFVDDGSSSFYNENEIISSGLKTSGIKSISQLKDNSISGLLSFTQEEKSKILLITNYGHIRIFDNVHTPLTQRLGKRFIVFRSFKNDQHKLVYSEKINDTNSELIINALTNKKELIEIKVDDFHLTPMDKYAKENIDLPKKSVLDVFFKTDDLIIDDTIKAEIPKETPTNNNNNGQNNEEESSNKNEDKKEDNYKQISIFDDEPD